MELFDAYLPLGRTNGAVKTAPRDEAEALALMDRLGVAEAMIGHVLSRDCNPIKGNMALASINSPRIHKVFGFEMAYIAPQKPDAFLAEALSQGAKAFMVNPGMATVKLNRNPRLGELAGLLEERAIPLIVAHNILNGPDNSLDWYDLADFCGRFPKLPVLAWQNRSRSNRPMLDALALTTNLAVLLSTMWQSQMIEGVVENFGPERVVFSLGLPGLHPEAFPAVLAYSDISPEDREAIAAGTMRRLLKEASYE